LRIDSLMMGTFRAAQVVSLLLMGASVVGLALVLRKK